MPDENPLQTAINDLLETAQRCRRLAASATDRQATERLLRLAKDYEECAAELRKQTSG